MNRRQHRLLAIALLFTYVLLASGCTTPHSQQRGTALLKRGDIQQAITEFSAALQEDPDNVELRLTLLRVRRQGVNTLLRDAQADWQNDKMVKAQNKLREAWTMATGHLQLQALVQQASRRLEQAGKLKEAKQAMAANEPRRAQAILRPLLQNDAGNPDTRQLLRDVDASLTASPLDASARFSKLARQISLEFRDTPVRSILQALARKSGVNFVFDPQAKAQTPITIVLSKVTVDQAVQSILASAQLMRRELSPGTFLIFTPTPQKLKEHQQLFTRTFYVAHADPERTAALVRQIGKVKDLFVDAEESLIVVRDTPDVIALVARLIEVHNRPRPEVVLDVEVLEIGSNALRDIGIRWPDQISAGLTASPGGRSGGAGTTFSLDQFRRLNSSFFTVSIPNPLLVATLRETAGDASILANPQIRVRQREKAKILIGDRVPVVTTTTTSTGLVSESVNYIDVGIKLDVEPEIYVNDDVGVKISLEVSNIVREIQTPSGSLTYQIGTRSVDTLLQLHNGETQMLAGLIKKEVRDSANKVPILADIPILGRLFSQKNKSQSKTEVVLLITPRIVRSRQSSGPSSEYFASGTLSKAGISVAGAALRADRSPTYRSTGSGHAKSTGIKEDNRVHRALATSPRSTQNPRSSAQKSRATLTVKVPGTFQIGRETAIPVRLQSQGPTIATGEFALHFDSDRFHAAFRAQRAGVRATVDNGLGIIRIRLNTRAKLDPEITLGELRLTATGTAPNQSTIAISAKGLMTAHGQSIKFSAVAPSKLHVVK